MADQMELIVEQAEKISDLEKYNKVLKNENEELRSQRGQSELRIEELGAANEMLQARLEEATVVGHQAVYLEEEENCVVALVRPWTIPVCRGRLSARGNTTAAVQALNPASAGSAAPTPGPATTSALSSRLTLSPEDVEAKSKELLEASKQGRVQDVYRLLKEGADASYKGYNDCTALHHAADRNHLAVVTALISFGAPINAKDNWSSTPLHCAAIGGHMEVVLALDCAGAEANVRDKIDITPLHYAVCFGHTECANALLGAGADPNAVNCQGETPLVIAASQGRGQLVRALLEAGGDPTIQNNLGKTARDVAQNDEIRQILH